MAMHRSTMRARASTANGYVSASAGRSLLALRLVCLASSPGYAQGLDRESGPLPFYDLQSRAWIGHSDRVGSLTQQEPLLRTALGFPLEPLRRHENTSIESVDFANAPFLWHWQAPSWEDRRARVLCRRPDDAGE